MTPRDDPYAWVIAGIAVVCICAAAWLLVTHGDLSGFSDGVQASLWTSVWLPFAN